MAGDWIKMRGNLWDDPRVSRICDMTDQNEASVIGALYWLWSSADQHTEDGFMPGLSCRQIDRKTGLQGFADALCSIGWIEQKDEGVTIVNFDEHNGASAKRRAQEAKRKGFVRKMSASNADKSETENGSDAELEKEKEKDNNNPPKSPQGGSVSRGKSTITLKTYLEQCKAEGVPAIAEDHPVQAYAESIGLPQSFLRLAWLDFKCEFTERNASKKYKSWSQHFNNWVQKNYHKLWWLDGDEYKLTTKGQQAAKQNNWRDE